MLVFFFDKMRLLILFCFGFFWDHCILARDNDSLIEPILQFLYKFKFSDNALSLVGITNQFFIYILIRVICLPIPVM